MPSPSTAPSPSFPLTPSAAAPASSLSTVTFAATSHHSPSSNTLAGRRSASTNTLSSVLFEEKRQAIRRFDEPSPYYRGLTDSGLALRGDEPVSPGHESRAPSIASSARSLPASVVDKFRGLGSSCFSSRKGKEQDDDDEDEEHEAGDEKNKLQDVLYPKGAAVAAVSPPTKAPASLQPPATGAWDPGWDLSAPAKTTVERPFKESIHVDPHVEAEEPLAEGADALGKNRRNKSKSGAKDRPSARLSRERENEQEKEVLAKSKWVAASASRTIRKSGPSSMHQAVPESLNKRLSCPQVPDVVNKTSHGDISAVPPRKNFVWHDRYRPKVLNKFICNRNMAADLQRMAASGECNHLIFEGLPGVGKRTMVSAFLREVFGRDLETTSTKRVFQLKGEVLSSTEVEIKTSPRHIEVNLLDLSGYEKHAVISLVEESSQKLKEVSKLDLSRHANCQVLVIYEADRLSTDAQLYLRWKMERHNGCTKVFFCCSNSSKLQPIQNLCKLVKLSPPSEEEIVEVLEYIAKNEGILLPHNLAKRMAENSKRNLRQAIRSFEASWSSSNSLKEDQEILTGWEEDITCIAKRIIEEQSPKQLYAIRGKLKNLIIEHNISPMYIFNNITADLKKYLDIKLHPEIDALYKDYSNMDNLDIPKDRYTKIPLDVNNESMKKMAEDPKWTMLQFMRIEEFTAKFMSVYKSHIQTVAAGRH